MKLHQIASTALGLNMKIYDVWSIYFVIENENDRVRVGIVISKIKKDTMKRLDLLLGQTDELLTQCGDKLSAKYLDTGCLSDQIVRLYQ